MRKVVSFCLLILCSFGVIKAENELSSLEKHIVKAFVNDLKYGRRELVAAAIRYPMERAYPLKPIMNADEFLEHYDDFIDDSFIEEVENSKWWKHRWRGICCGSGILWGNVDDNDEFRTSFDVLTLKGVSVWKAAVESQRKRLFNEIQSFERPVLMFKTLQFIIRVDELSGDVYRYVCWNKGHDISSKPNLIINNGVLNAEGTLHLKYYIFTNGEYEYIIGPGGQDYDFLLTVSKNGRELMTQKGRIIY